jgi:hypothetical protein
VDGVGVSDDRSFPGDEAGTPVTLDAGVYSVTEDGPGGYAASYSDDCSGTIALGDNLTCTITNNDVAQSGDPDPIVPDPIVPDPIVPDPIVPDPIVPDPIVPDPAEPDPVTPPVTNPVADLEVDSAAETSDNPTPTPPLQAVPVPTPSLPVPAPVTPAPATSPAAAAELPRTGAGLREQTLLALFMMFAGLSVRTLGSRRRRPADV